MGHFQYHQFIVAVFHSKTNKTMGKINSKNNKFQFLFKICKTKLQFNHTHWQINKLINNVTNNDNSSSYNVTKCDVGLG